MLTPSNPENGAPEVQKTSPRNPEKRIDRQELGEMQPTSERDASRGQELTQVREQIGAQLRSTTPPSDRARVLLGDFVDIGRGEGNKHVLPEDVAQEVKGQTRSFAESRGVIWPWYFLKGNKTATGYNSPFVANRSTMTGIRTLSDGRRVFLIDPKGSQLHRRLDSFFRRRAGHPARKVSVREWKQVLLEKSEIPVLQSEENATFPQGNIVALPFIPNVNGLDYFANNKHINFPEGYEWAKEAGLAEKMVVAEEAVRMVDEMHKRQKVWGEIATHNLLIADRGKAVIPADTEVEYDADVPLDEKKARDVFDLTMTIAGALHKSEGISGSDYDGVISRLFSAYSDKTVLQETARVAKLLQAKQGIFYPIYEQQRLNGLPLVQYRQISDAMQNAA